MKIVRGSRELYSIIILILSMNLSSDTLFQHLMDPSFEKVVQDLNFACDILPMKHELVNTRMSDLIDR